MRLDVKANAFLAAIPQLSLKGGYKRVDWGRGHEADSQTAEIFYPKGASGG